MAKAYQWIIHMYKRIGQDILFKLTLSNIFYSNDIDVHNFFQLTTTACFMDMKVTHKVKELFGHSSEDSKKFLVDFES